MLTFDYNGEKVVVYSSQGWKRPEEIDNILWERLFFEGFWATELVDDVMVCGEVTYPRYKHAKDYILKNGIFTDCKWHEFKDRVVFTDAFIEHGITLEIEYEIEKARLAAEREYKERVANLKDQVESAQYVVKEGCGWCSEKYYDREQRCQMCKYACKALRFRDEDIEWQFECWKEAKALKIEQEYFAPAYPVVGCKYLVEGQRALETLREMGEA